MANKKKSSDRKRTVDTNNVPPTAEAITAGESPAAEGATTATSSDDDDIIPGRRVSNNWIGKVTVYVIFPIFMGIVGVYLAYLDQIRNGTREISFDSDFMMPALLALTMVVILSWQTNGFQGNTTAQPLIQWPKARRRIKKVIVKKKKAKTKTEDDNGNDESGDAKPSEAKKDD